MTSVDAPYSSRGNSENRGQRRPHLDLFEDRDEGLPLRTKNLASALSAPVEVPDHGETNSSREGSPLPSSTAFEPVEDQEDARPWDKKMRALLPKSWGSLFSKWRRGDVAAQQELTEENILPNGTRVSPPVSPLLNQRYWDFQDSVRSSKGSQKPLLNDSSASYYHAGSLFHDPLEGSELTSLHPAQYYAEKLEVYQQKYSYMKSWPGLLRLLAGVQLLFGGMVFACVCAYVQKDSEWYNLNGIQGPNYGGYGGYGTSGYKYNGPMTPLVLAVAGLAWLGTVILLVLGLTMYYRTILLDSHWWPLTEAIVNVALFLLYMAAGIVYVNDLNRGGLCYMTVGFNPLMSSLCRVEGGQMAGTAFIFINMILYLVSFLVSLKMWRHEAARLARGSLEEEPPPPANSVQLKSKRIMFEDEKDQSVIKDQGPSKRIQFSEDPGTVNRAIPTGHIPKPRIIPDYIMKYPEIQSLEDREQYKAVFNDQYEEYKELHSDVSATLRKFSEMEGMLRKLLNDITSHEEQRIHQLMKTYKQKKNDPAFLEKRERCEYLKAKLKHIKERIQHFDQHFDPRAETRRGPKL